jgi:hypothetical protein
VLLVENKALLLLLECFLISTSNNKLKKNDQSLINITGAWMCITPSGKISPDDPSIDLNGETYTSGIHMIEDHSESNTQPPPPS